MDLVDENGSSSRARPLFFEKAEQLQQLGSLPQSQKDRAKSIPGIEGFAGILGTMDKVGPKLEALAPELEILKALSGCSTSRSRDDTRRLSADEFNDGLVESVAYFAKLPRFPGSIEQERIKRERLGKSTGLLSDLCNIMGNIN